MLGWDVAGLFWGGIAVVALPTDPQWQGMVALVVFGFIASNSIFAAPHRAATEARRGGRVCAVLFLDLDRFQIVNDSLGHAFGDQLLTLVARQVEPALRDGDGSRGWAATGSPSSCPSCRTHRRRS